MITASTRQCFGPALALLAMLWCALPEVVAQQSPLSGAEQATIEESAPINNLIKRARQGIERRDWKLAIDSLQRIIDDPQPVLLERSPRLYESARRYAVRRLAELPPDGLAAYRILNDGRARAGLERAVAEHDADGLRQVVHRYLLTGYGDNAAEVLASWLLDEGRSAEALGLLDEIVEFCRDSDVPTGSVAARRAVALAMMGQGTSAAALAARASKQLSEDVGSQLERLVGDLVDGAGPGAAVPAGQQGGTWPILGGGGDRRGAMPAVTPTLLAEVPWRRALPDARPEDWTDYLGKWDETRIPPVSHVVVSEGRLLVKGPRRCAAIDLESFDLLWEGEPEVEGIAERYMRRMLGGGLRQVEGKVASDHRERLLHDYVGGSLSAVGGLLFSVERSGGGRYFDGDGVFQRMGQRILVPRRLAGLGSSVGEDLLVGNRLVAYDAAIGAVRWQRGRSADPSDPLYGVEFLSPPIAVSEELWVPALLNDDLYVVVLDPATGETIHRIMLCTPPTGTVQTNEALWPVVGGGSVYVPTGQGLLFALRVSDYSPLWAARYERGEASRWRGTGIGPHYWLSSPPIVSGPLVLLAPTDADQLLAFDRRSGELRWSVSRGDHRYLIAADGDNVWVGGERVSCLSAQDGSTIWTGPLLESTGRAILSGGRMYVPTAGGLVALGAAEGEVISETPMPPGHPPLGNLLALPDGLISVDAYEVRKYPDLDQAYARTVAAHEADPAGPTTAIRLAWMELLRGAPQQALVALDQAEVGDSVAGRRRGDQLAHLRAEALIALSTRAGTGPEEAITYLGRALDHATVDEDVVRAGLALGRHLERAGRFEDAYRYLWQLGQSKVADLPVTTAEQITRPARLVIAGQLGRLEGHLAHEVLVSLTQEAA
ncbi:MAG: outer membrane protein assembly factor BamB family protein, partial [Planctomycetota bacterium]